MSSTCKEVGDICIGQLKMLELFNFSDGDNSISLQMPIILTATCLEKKEIANTL